MEEIKGDKKVLYHFTVFAILNKLLIIKNHRISLAYWLTTASARPDAATHQSCWARVELFITMATHKRRVTLNPYSKL